MKRILVILFCLISSMVFSQTFKIAISKTGNDYGMHTIETSDKGCLIVGYTTGGTAVGEDGIAAKIDQNGNLQWYKIFSNSGIDRLNGCLEMNSSYFLVGNTTSASAGGQDGWVIKLDLNGNILWSRRFGGTLDEGFYKVIRISQNRMMICGYMDGNPGEKYANFYMVKMRDDGTVLFEANYGSVGHQTNSARNLILTPAGNIILSGYSYCFGAGLHDGVTICADTATGARIWTKSYGSANEDGFNSIANTKDGFSLCNGYAKLDGAAFTKYWLLKINTSGDTLWQKSYFKSTTVDNTGFTAQANDNGFIVALNEKGVSANLMKVDNTGAVMWTKQFNGPGVEEFNSIMTTSDNHFLAVGQTNSFGSGDLDLFIVKTDLNGDLDSCCSKPANVSIKISHPVVTTQTQLTAFTNFIATYTNTNANLTGTVISNCEVLRIDTAHTNIPCYGNNNGTATVSVISGVSPYTYIWSTIPASTNATVTGLPPGTYTVTVTDAIGCTETQSVTITQPSALTASVSNTNVLCNGGNDGSSNASVSGGVSPYSYSWSTIPVQTGINASGLSAGTYYLTVTDANGCTETLTSIITEPALISGSIIPANVTCNGLCDGTANVTGSGGNPGYSYSWSTTPVQNSANATGLCAGNYTVTITDASGCTQLSTIVITEPTILAVTTTQSDINCYGDINGSSTVNVIGGTSPYSYLWSPGGGTNATAVGLAAGVYTVTVTDDNGCIQQSTVTITEPSAITTTLIATLDSCAYNVGTVTVNAAGGTSPYDYIWSPGGQTNATATGLGAGTYTLTVTDDNGCTETNSEIVNVFGIVTPVAGPNSSICPGEPATITASGGLYYLWNNSETTSSITVSPSITTSYSVVVSNDICSATTSAIVTVNPNPLIDAGTPQTICSGYSATLTASGAINYLWSTSEITSSITVTPASLTTYTVTGTDANGCTGSTSVVVDVVTINATANSIDAHCGHSDGSATTTTSGNCSQGWTYLWNSTPPQTTLTATGLPAGTYTVTVSCGSCTITASATVGDLPGPSVSVANIINTTCSYANGSATASATGGTPGYSYFWSNSQTGQNLSNVLAGTYTVTATDANGCTSTSAVIITDTPSPSAIVSSVNEFCDKSNGFANATVSGGSGPYLYSWSNGATSSTVTGLSAGNYSVTVTDNNGCTTYASVNVQETPGPDADFFAHPHVLTTMDDPVSFNDNSSGNVVNWQWDFGDGSPDGSGQIIYHDYDIVGNYLVTLVVTDNNGCTDTATDTIKVKDIFTFYVPNAFTPDGDGFNDYFFPQGVNWDPDHFEMYIFDRWGNMIFHTKTIGDAWDGTLNNNGSPDDMFIDVYVYLIMVKELEGSRHEYLGRVTLVK